MKLWIFAVQGYGAMVSYDGGEPEDTVDEAVIVGYQYADDRHQALDRMAEEIAENMGFSKPDGYEKDDPSDEEMDAMNEYDDKLEEIKDQLQYFELVVGGQHTTAFLS